LNCLGCSSDRGGKGEPVETMKTVEAMEAITKSGCSMGNMMVIPDNGGSLDLLDNRFTNDGNGVRYRDWFSNMVRSWHFDDFFNMFDNIIRNFVWFFNVNGFVDSVNFFLNGDNGCSDRLGAFQSSGHGDFEVRNGGLQDFGGVARDVLGLAKMDLFGNDGFGFVKGGHVGFLGLGHVRCRQRNGGGCNTMGITNSGCSMGVPQRMGQMGGMGQSYSAGRQDCCGGVALANRAEITTNGFMVIVFFISAVVSPTLAAATKD